MMWNRMSIDAIPLRPLILVGQGWRETMDEFYRTMDGYVPAKSRGLLCFAENVDGAFELLQQRSAGL